MTNHDGRKQYHVCFTSHNEVLFRKREDISTFINCTALSSYKTNSPILVDAEMSTHVHLQTLTLDPGPLINLIRARYTKYFNREYQRTGPLGERYFFKLQLDGRNHIIAASSYILRNGLHHAQSSSAFGYEFCSARDIFCIELGYKPEEIRFCSRSEIASFLPRFSEFPDNYAMNKDGVFIRRSFEEIEMMQGLYGSARSYNYMLSRQSSEEWKKEQERDGNGHRPITIGAIEPFVNTDSEIDRMLYAEKGYDYHPSRLTDMDLCEIVDKQLASRQKPITIYQASDIDKSRLAHMLKYDLHASSGQISRVLIYPEYLDQTPKL